MDIKLDNEKLHGEVMIPPSISLLHLSLIAAALTGLHTGKTEAWDNLAGACMSISEDLAATIKGLQVIAEKAYQTESVDTVMIPEKTIKASMGTKDLNMGMLPKTTIKCGDSEETMRLFMPIVAALGVDVTYMCGKNLYGSNLTPFADQLEKHGAFLMKASICAQATNASGMICVRGQLMPGAYIVPSNISVSFVTGLIFALTLLKGKSSIRVLGTLQSVSYIRMALKVLDQSGISIRTNSSFTEFEIEGAQSYNLSKAEVEGDWTIGAYFVGAGAIGRIFDTRGQYAKPIIYPVVKEGVLACGNINIHNLSLESGQDASEIVKIINDMSDNLAATMEIPIEKYPEIVPILAVYAALRIGMTTFTGTMKLHSKDAESIRYSCDMIRALGGRIKADNNSVTILGWGGLKGGLVDTRNNPLIAMAAAMAARLCEEPVVIRNVECVNRFYSRFFDDYGSLQW